MRRGLVHTGGWTLATGAMIALSWYGVHSVLADSVVDGPRSMPAVGSPPAAPAGALSALPGLPSSPSAKSPSPTTSSPSPSATRSATPTPPPSSAASAAVRPPATPRPTPSTTGGRHTYTVEGGRTVLDLGASSATLVSATPDAGWSAQWWEQSGSIRVDFTSGNRTSEVLCTWGGHAPVVQTSTA